MSVLPSSIVFYGSANMQETDTGSQGGAIDLTRKVTFIDVAPAGTVEVVSSDAGDTTQTVTITGRDAAGVIVSEVETLSGVTPVPTAQSFERLLKAVKSATTIGDVACMETTNETTGTAQGAAAETASEMAYITGAVGEITTDGDFQGMVIRTTGGTGPNQIRWIVDTRASDDRIWVNRDWDVLPDATTTYEIAEGMVFEKTPNEITEIRRPFYDVAADVAGGASRSFYEKIFARNNHGTLALTGATIAEAADPSTNIAFDLESTLDGTDTATNRITAPGGYTFDSTTKNVANSQNHSAGSGQGIWLELTLPAGEAAAKTTYDLQESGSST